MKRTIAVISIAAVFGIIFISGNAWANEGRRGYGSGQQVYCKPQTYHPQFQNRGYIEKRYVEYRRPAVEQRYRREYVNQYRNSGSKAVQKGNNGNHYGWFQNQSNNHANLTADQKAKAKEFFEKQKSDRKSFLDSLKS